MPEQYILNRGIRIPLGWIVRDSIQYDGDFTGKWIFSESMSDSIENKDPSPVGYYCWWRGGFASRW
jgi:hypothetical protein